MKHPLTRWCPFLLLILAGVLAYWNSFDGVFIYDDILAVRDNVHIRNLWPLSEALSLDQWATGSTVDGRPLLSLSFAVNYALLGNAPWGYHLVNLLIHLAAALLIFGIVRSTLTHTGRFRAAQPTALALGVALLWTVHPIQTESITYIVQRAESLMGLFYLLTLYASLRAFHIKHSPSAIPWRGVAILACALGMAVKEVMITAPMAVLLYDYTFVSGSFLKALRKRPGFYAGLFASWIVLFGLVFCNRADVAENFGVAPWPSYLFAQPGVILHYLRLCVWPRPLLLAYDWPLASGGIVVMVQTALVGGLLVLSLWGLWRRHWAGFVGTVFFLVLSPTSSILPSLQVIHEHRMYVSLAAVVTLAVAGVQAALTRIPRVSAVVARQPKSAFAVLPPILVVAVLFGIMTVQRNRDYHSEIAFWQHNVDHRPESYVAHCGLGQALQSHGRPAEAIEHYRRALRIEPKYAEAHYNWGLALTTVGRTQEAMACYQQALRLNPNHVNAHNNLGNALQALGRTREAIPHYRDALRLKPGMAEAHDNLGNALRALGRFGEAITQHEQALRIRPGWAEAHYNLGNALRAQRRFREAIATYEQALRVKPDYAEAHYNLGLALEAMGRPLEAVGHYQATVRIKPNLAVAHCRLGIIYQQSGRIAAAIRHYEQTLRLKPDFAEARQGLREMRAMTREPVVEDSL
ncbi:MAG: tetratricopeptide repeat protein [Verrucomicrobia bacterium]|jgi:protein O-mannosyl-transferase|nr:tetratricopeptide repeat protein [Verrucomicrobiota bacterium]MBT7067573.1 tetratricopeptide repeat protein [Verrucomicrobiota bacterium]MBT7700141.1 tetratricopeptide repeat protein [Verrucomicrobiota bacterium]